MLGWRASTSHSGPFGSRVLGHDRRFDVPPGKRRLAMDLALYGSVLWRFRLIVFLGVLLAVALTVLSVAKVTSSGLEYREHETWQAESTLLLTQPGFPEGRALFPNPEANGPQSKYSYADAGRFASLTALYSQFAQSDEVRALVRREGAPPGSSVSAAPVIPAGSNAYTLLPVIALFGTGQSRGAAVETAQLGTQAFIGFLERNQREAEIPDSQRVHVEVLARPREAVVIEPRKKTLPIVVFLTVLTGTVSLAFLLENLRSRVRPVPDVASRESTAVTDARRTA
jgi:hypothetical protein